MYLASPAQAELYLGGQVGASVPEKLTQIRGTKSSSGVQGSDLDLSNNLAFGVKVGYFLPRSWNWLRGEVEFYHRDSNIGQQPFTANGPLLVASGTGTIPRTGLAVNTIAWNAVVRYPGTVLQPYVVVGPGVTWALLRTSPRCMAVAPSQNLLS